MKRRKKKKRISKIEAILLIIIGICMGSALTFLNCYLFSKIEVESSIGKNIIYESYWINYGKNHTIDEIIVDFYDNNQFYIAGECVNNKLIDDLNKIQSGTEVSLLIHPNSDTILDMRSDDCVILEFDNAQDKISRERNAFFIIGLFMYGIAIYGIINLVLIKLKND